MTSKETYQNEVLEAIGIVLDEDCQNLTEVSDRFKFIASVIKKCQFALIMVSDDLNKISGELGDEKVQSLYKEIEAELCKITSNYK
jgi:hypothetical protein